ncbi:MAG: DUF2254 domain-containing protein [Pseudomonadota bacterium]
MQLRKLTQRLGHWVYSIGHSYWLVPAAMTLAAIVLAVVLIGLSVRFDSRLHETLGQWSVVKPGGARAILATIAGSMMTVAGVTFSVTTLALSHATANYGPRLFANFLKDRGSQITLGTFVAAFVFSVVTLAAVSTGDDGYDFVPHLALIVAFALSLAGVAVLIFFVQHAQQRLYIASIVARLGRQLVRRVPAIYGNDDDEARRLEDSELPQRRSEIQATESAYLQHVKDMSLVAAAQAHDAVVRLCYAPGQFVVRGTVLAEVFGGGDVDAAIAEEIHASLQFGDDRTPEQDLMFVVDQIAQVSLRALSPGINDPFTANTCLDWLASFLALLAGRSPQTPAMRDDQGDIRALIPAPTFDDILEHTLEQLRAEVCSNLISTRHAIPLLARLRSVCRGTELGADFERHFARWRRTIDDNDWSATDKATLDSLWTDH